MKSRNQTAEHSNDSIRLSNGEGIYLAKERYNEFVKAYMRYLRNGGTACVDVVSAVQEVLYALFQGYCLQYFLGAFLENRYAFC